ncbi:hypothetical protein [Anaerovorax odorimutans]|uniref:hypothetical protein n=1 Tax=Anaerovorax odorimutans TaxID=109327 RepID=UPI0003FF4814|nr:hypothetical protein [Anaerovorax odorimutans]
MACFLVPMAEAIVVTAVKKTIEKKERNAALKEKKEDAVYHSDSQSNSILNSKSEISWSRKLSWLTRLLWGGVLLLAIEHVWHGEVVPWPPFLTAMNNPADVGPMLHEMATFGTTMAILVTVVWYIMVLIIDQKYKAFSATLSTKI